MSLSLKEVLAFPPFVDANARVVAGEESLDRAVRWVHCSEMSESARLFQGNELLLTQGRGISRQAAEQKKWVDRLSDADVAGLGIETGVIWPEIPDAIIRRARERGFPVVTMQHPAYFMLMTKAVHSAIVNSHYDALLRTEQLGNRLSKLALAGANLQSVLDELASTISHPVVLTDRAHQVEVYAPRTERSLGMITHWQSHSRQRHDYFSASESAHTVTSGGLRCTYRSIIYQGNLWGCLHVLHDDASVDELTLLALDRAVMSIGLAFAVAEGERRHDDGARSTLIQDLLSASVGDSKDVALQARVFGMDLSVPLRVVMVQPVDGYASRGEPVGSNRRLRAVLNSVASEAEKILGGAVLMGYSGTRVVGICPSSADVNGLAAIQSGPGIGLLVGVSSITELSELPRAGSDAGQALQYALQTGSDSGIFFADRLGIERLLLKLDEGHSLVDHIERELGAVLDHDASSASPLMPTLEAYLMLSGNKTEVAKSLHIERRSLYHRLERIRSLIGADIDHPDRQLGLRIAVRGLGYRRKRAESGPQGTRT